MLKCTHGWAIYGKGGLYVDWKFTRQDIINWHCQCLNKTWEECRKKGDRAIKVEIYYEFPKK